MSRSIKSKGVSIAMLFMPYCFALIGCGSSQQPDMVTLSNEKTTPSPKVQQTEAGAQGIAEAGRYAQHISKFPLPPSLKPYEPKLLFYGLYVNCASCHEWAMNLDQVKARLKKVKRTGSIQDLITSGRMPPSKPKFASSPEGIELLQLLNGL